MWEQLEMFEMDYVCTDSYPAYGKIIPDDMHIITKSETAAIEGFNSRIRHYLARFHRKTFYYSKAIHMVQATLTVLFTDNWITCLS
ncbi:MAG: IS1 family transposase [Bdellovibrionales bacterium]